MLQPQVEGRIGGPALHVQVAASGTVFSPGPVVSDAVQLRQRHKLNGL
jgi:hypothetical protein